MGVGPTRRVYGVPIHEAYVPREGGIEIHQEGSLVVGGEGGGRATVLCGILSRDRGGIESLRAYGIEHTIDEDGPCRDDDGLVA